MLLQRVVCEIMCFFMRQIILDMSIRNSSVLPLHMLCLFAFYSEQTLWEQIHTYWKCKVKM